MDNNHCHAVVPNVTPCYWVWHKLCEAEHSVQHLHHCHFVEYLHIVLKRPTFQRISTLYINNVGNYAICHDVCLNDKVLIEND